ncbi:MAG: hypothetical protein M1839_001718 [Geoglossum umbratile]|nr:MAG: hypothetical protein M1839_001718 [Geoglossum umbratile]
MPAKDRRAPGQVVRVNTNRSGIPPVSKDIGNLQRNLLDRRLVSEHGDSEPLPKRFLIPDNRSTAPEPKAAFVKDSLVMWERPWIMVFDSYDQTSRLKNTPSYFPQGQVSTILFTSRHAESERLGTAIRVMQMTEEEGLELLLRRCALGVNGDNAAEGRKIIQGLGSLPLLLTRQMRTHAHESSRSGFLPKNYDKRKEVVLKHTPLHWEYRKRLGEDEDETLLSVFTTWELSIQQLGKGEDERALIYYFLTLSAFFDTTNIEELLFKLHLTGNSPGGWSNLYLEVPRTN